MNLSPVSGTLDSCAVSDALDKLGLKGSVTGIHRFTTEQRIAGRVLTVKLDRAEGRTNTRHLCTAAIDSGQARRHHRGRAAHRPRRRFMGRESRDRRKNAQRGRSDRGRPGARYRRLPQIDFPSSRAATLRAPRADGSWKSQPTSPSASAMSKSTPGDYVVADGSGVVFVAANEIARVLDTAEGIVAREEAMAQALREGVRSAR